MNPHFHAVEYLDRRAGFSLVELLSVIAIIAAMTAASTPLIQSLTAATSVDKAIVEFSGVYETARIYAMTHRTYTRVGIAQAAPDQTVSLPSLIVATIYSVDGSLTQDDDASMADNSRWKLAAKPCVLSNLWIYDSIESSEPSTSGDSLPSASDIGGFTRQAGNKGMRTFSSIVQFNPLGEARILKSEPARFIKIAVDQPLSASAPATSPRNRNPFILRLSGLNGNLNVIRKESIR